MAVFGLARAETSQLDGLISLSRRAGVPVAALARSRAALNRDLARTDAEDRLQRLGVAVVLPLGVLVLPAFVLLAVVPMALILWDGAVG
jgi:tight adherence protein B